MSARSTRAFTSRSRPCGLPRTSTPRRFATRATGSRISSEPPPRATCFSSATRRAIAFPLTAEGIRTAFYFGIACGRELRAVSTGTATSHGTAPPGQFSPAQSGSSIGCWRPRAVPRVPRGCWRRRSGRWSAGRSWTGRSGTTCGSPIRASRAIAELEGRGGAPPLLRRLLFSSGRPGTSQPKAKRSPQPAAP